MEKKSPRILTKLSKSSSKMSSAFGHKDKQNGKELSAIGSSATLPAGTSGVGTLSSLSTKELKKQHDKQLKLQAQLAKQEAKLNKKQKTQQSKTQQKQDKPGTSSAANETMLAAASGGVETTHSELTSEIDNIHSQSICLDTDRDEESRFTEGMQFRGKLIGIEPVMAARGDGVCQAAFKNLRLRRTSSGHKQRILINVKLTGVQLLDAKSSDLVANHAIHLISYITRDAQDERSFGYVYGTPEVGHQLIAIKSEKNAMFVMNAIGELFTYVYNRKKKEKQEHQQLTAQQVSNVAAVSSVLPLSVTPTPVIENSSTTSASVPTITATTTLSSTTLQPIQPTSMSLLQPTTVHFNLADLIKPSSSKASEQSSVKPRPVPSSRLVGEPAFEFTAREQPKRTDSEASNEFASTSTSFVAPPPPPRNPHMYGTLSRAAQQRLLGQTRQDTLEKQETMTQSSNDLNSWQSQASTASTHSTTHQRTNNWQIFSEEDKSTTAIDGNIVNLNRTSSLQSKSSAAESINSERGPGFVDSFVEAQDWPQRSPPKFPAPQLEAQSKASSECALQPLVATKDGCLGQSVPGGSLAFVRLGTPPSSAVRRRPRRTSDSCRSTSEASSLADTSIDMPSALLDGDLTNDESSTLRLNQEGRSSSELNSSTLCISGTAAGIEESVATGDQLATSQQKYENSSLGESRCTSKMDSTSSIFSVSSLGTPSPGLKRRSLNNNNLTCETITNQLQSMAAKLVNPVESVASVKQQSDFTFEQAFGDKPTTEFADFSKVDEQTPFPPSNFSSHSVPASSSNHRVQYETPMLRSNLTNSKGRSSYHSTTNSRSNEDKYAVFHQPEVLLSTSIFDPLFDPEKRRSSSGSQFEGQMEESFEIKDLKDKEEKRMSSKSTHDISTNSKQSIEFTKRKSSISSEQDNSFDMFETNLRKTVESEEPKTSLNSAASDIAKESNFLNDGHESRKSIDSQVNDYGTLDRQRSQQHRSSLDRGGSMRSNSDASTATSLNLSTLSLATGDIFDPLTTFSSSTVGSGGLLNPTETLATLEKQFERARMHLQLQQRNLNKQHLHQQQRLLQQQKQLQLDFTRQTKQRLQSQPPQAIVAARTQQQLQQRRLQQQFVQQQQWLKQLQQTQQIQLLDNLQQLQQAYLERKSALLQSADSAEGNDQKREEEEAAAQVPNIFESQRASSVFALNEATGIGFNDSGSISMLNLLGFDSMPPTSSDSVDPLMELGFLGSITQNPQLASSASSLVLHPDRSRCSTSCSVSSVSSHNPFLMTEERRPISVFPGSSVGVNGSGSLLSLDPLSLSHGSGALLSNRNNLTGGNSQSEDPLFFNCNQSPSHQQHRHSQHQQQSQQFVNRSCNATFESLLMGSGTSDSVPADTNLNSLASTSEGAVSLNKPATSNPVDPLFEAFKRRNLDDLTLSSSKSSNERHGKESRATAITQSNETKPNQGQSQIGEQFEDPFNCNFVDTKLNEISRISQIRHQTQRQLLPITAPHEPHSPGSLCVVQPPASPFTTGLRGGIGSKTNSRSVTVTAANPTVTTNFADFAKFSDHKNVESTVTAEQQKHLSLLQNRTNEQRLFHTQQQHSQHNQTGTICQHTLNQPKDALFDSTPFDEYPQNSGNRLNINSLGQFNSFSELQLNSLCNTGNMISQQNQLSASNLHLNIRPRPTPTTAINQSTKGLTQLPSHMTQFQALIKTNNPPDRNIFHVQKDPFEDDFFR